MRITNLNIWHGGSKNRNPLIIDYLLSSNSDLMVLTDLLIKRMVRRLYRPWNWKDTRLKFLI